jgi:predicted DNA-binding WGR domain protein
MMLYLVKDGIMGVGWVTSNDKQVLGTNFYLITYDFKTNEGYVEKKGENYWRLYTQIGQKFGQSRYHQFTAFEQCIKKLKELKGDDNILICKADEIQNYK